MLELLETYTEVGFLDAMTSLSPAVGFGLILGFIIAIFGWLFGLLIRMSKVEA